MSRENYLRVSGLAALTAAASHVAGIVHFPVDIDFATVWLAVSPVLDGLGGGNEIGGGIFGSTRIVRFVGFGSLLLRASRREATSGPR